MSKRTWIVICLLAVCALIDIVQLLSIKDSEFGGADGAADEVIAAIDPNY